METENVLWIMVIVLVVSLSAVLAYVALESCPDCNCECPDQIKQDCMNETIELVNQVNLLRAVLDSNDSGGII